MAYMGNTLMVRNIYLNVALNGALLLSTMLFMGLFAMTNPAKESCEWYQKLGFKILAANLSVLNTALAIPYLITNMQYLFCSVLADS